MAISTFLLMGVSLLKVLHMQMLCMLHLDMYKLFLAGTFLIVYNKDNFNNQRKGIYENRAKKS